MNPKKELLRGLWVNPKPSCFLADLLSEPVEQGMLEDVMLPQAARAHRNKIRPSDFRSLPSTDDD